MSESPTSRQRVLQAIKDITGMRPTKWDQNYIVEICHSIGVSFDGIASAPDIRPIIIAALDKLKSEVNSRIEFMKAAVSEIKP